MLDKPIQWRGEAVYLWESKQQTVFTFCCLQSYPFSLLSGSLNLPNDGARMIYVVGCEHAFSTLTGKNQCIVTTMHRYA